MDISSDLIIIAFILFVYLICFFGVICCASSTHLTCASTPCNDESKYIESEPQYDSKNKTETLTDHEYLTNDKTAEFEESKIFKLLNKNAHKSTKLPTQDLVKKPSILEIP